MKVILSVLSVCLLSGWRGSPVVYHTWIYSNVSLRDPIPPSNLFKLDHYLALYLLASWWLAFDWETFLLHWRFTIFRFRRMPKYVSKVVQKYQAWRQLCRKVQCTWWCVLWCSLLDVEIYQAEKNKFKYSMHSIKPTSCSVSTSLQAILESPWYCRYLHFLSWNGYLVEN